MIREEFSLEDLNLKYYVGINQIEVDIQKLIQLNKLQNENTALNYIFSLIEKIQSKYNGTIVQFFNDAYVLNQDHVFKSIYFVQKAFLNNFNISNRKNIEFLLYLAGERQIKNAIEAIGLNISNLKDKLLTYCVISQDLDNLTNINGEILRALNSKDIALTLNKKSLEKFHRIKKFFNLSDNQIRIVLNSYDIKVINNNLTKNNLDDLFLALHDLICEKMALLSVEKIKND